MRTRSHATTVKNFLHYGRQPQKIADCSDGVEDFCEGSRPDPSQVGFQFREGLFDGVQIGRVWRQVEEPAAVVAQGLCRFLVPVGRQVVEDNDGARRDLGDQHLADVGGKGGAIHRALYDPWCDQGILGQACDQCLCAPAAKGRIHRQALAPLCPSTQAGQIGFHCGFINKDNAFGQGCNGRKPMFEPVRALLPYLGAMALGGDQRLFLYVNPSRDSKLAMEE